MNPKPKITCTIHGDSEPYVVCPHVMIGIPVCHLELAEDAGGIGVAVCHKCDEYIAINGVTEDLKKIMKSICRGCGVKNGILPWREGDPQPDILEPKLASGEERHKEHPESFEIPPLELRQSCEKGLMVKLLWEAANGKGERMWVEVDHRREDGKYVGHLRNAPVVFRDCLKKDQQVVFGPENIICI